MEVLRIESDEEGDLLEHSLEIAIEDQHRTSVEESENPEILAACRSGFRVLMRLLKRLSPEHPLFENRPKCGEEFDWDAFWASVDQRDGDDPEDGDPEDEEDEADGDDAPEDSASVAGVAEHEVD